MVFSESYSYNHCLKERHAPLPLLGGDGRSPSLQSDGRPSRSILMLWVEAAHRSFDSDWVTPPIKWTSLPRTTGCCCCAASGREGHVDGVHQSSERRSYSVTNVTDLLSALPPASTRLAPTPKQAGISCFKGHRPFRSRFPRERFLRVLVRRAGFCGFVELKDDGVKITIMFPGWFRQIVQAVVLADQTIATVTVRRCIQFLCVFKILLSHTKDQGSLRLGSHSNIEMLVVHSNKGSITQISRKACPYSRPLHSGNNKTMT